MKLVEDRRGFLDTEVLGSLGFLILFGGVALATAVGYIVSKKFMEFSFPVWQLLIIIVVEFFGAYFFASRG